MVQNSKAMEYVLRRYFKSIANRRSLKLQSPIKHDVFQNVSRLIHTSGGGRD